MPRQGSSASVDGGETSQPAAFLMEASSPAVPVGILYANAALKTYCGAVPLGICITLRSERLASDPFHRGWDVRIRPEEELPTLLQKLVSQVPGLRGASGLVTDTAPGHRREITVATELSHGGRYLVRDTAPRSSSTSGATTTTGTATTEDPERGSLCAPRPLRLAHSRHQDTAQGTGVEVRVLLCVCSRVEGCPCRQVPCGCGCHSHRRWRCWLNILAGAVQGKGRGKGNEAEPASAAVDGGGARGSSDETMTARRERLRTWRQSRRDVPIAPCDAAKGSQDHAASLIQANYRGYSFRRGAFWFYQRSSARARLGLGELVKMFQREKLTLKALFSVRLGMRSPLHALALLPGVPSIGLRTRAPAGS